MSLSVAVLSTSASSPFSRSLTVVYRIGYLKPLAIVRLLLLFLPLLFHSYTGTALKLPTLYQLLYFGTLALLCTHILLLCFLNPESIESLFPISDHNPLRYLHELRRIWWMLLASFVANLCHLFLFWHVRSTAQYASWRRQPSVYFAVRSSELEHEEPALMNAMNDLLMDLQVRLQRTKSEWTARIDGFTARLNDRAPSPLTPFRVLCLLFAHEDVLANGKLDAVFEADDGASVTFYIPQLLSFLLHGALYSSPRLEEWILDKCRRSPFFAHRCYWFLRAWCLEVPAEPALQPTSPYVDEPASPTNPTECMPRRDAPSSSSSVDKFLPGERAMIEGLMQRVKECGERPALSLEYGDEEVVNLVEQRLHMDVSPSALMSAVESGSIPSDPVTGGPSVKHLDCLSAHRTYGFLPMETSEPRSSPRRTSNETEFFERTPRFLDALINLADSLHSVPRESRKDVLRNRLRAIECQLLPSNSTYLPMTNIHHRVWRIAAEESLPLSTKERVPCIVCVEVVDYTPKRRVPRAWSILSRGLPHRESSHGSTISNTESWSEMDGLSDRDTVDSWRFAKRNPMRRESIIDKVTSTMKESVKGPLDKMKHHLSHLRDRSTSEELRTLTLVEALVDDSTTDLADAMERASIGARRPSSDRFDLPEESMFIPEEKTNGLSRASSAGSLTSMTSMGQWSSPHKELNPDTVSSAKFNGNLGDVRRRVDRDGSTTGSSSLIYGSDEEREPSTSPSKTRRHVSGQLLATETPNTTAMAKKSKRPPVVFKESWKTKMERVRKSSAFGNDPGWRLLPILIKANDDLRQEQLASQLIYRMASILARDKVPVWLCPYEIVALTDRGGVIECVPDTISLDSLKKNDPNYTNLRSFFVSHFGEGTDELADARANFVESLAAYSVVCFLLQLKDRHNGNILLDAQGHLVHIDFGFFFLSSPGKNVGFESAPFKLTRDFVEVMDGPHSRLFRVFRELCVRTFLSLRKHCMEIILLVEMLKHGNEELHCFRGRPDVAIAQLRERFRLDLNDRACREYVNSLIDDSIENWRTDWYDRYQRYFVGIL